jgi:hypothetical protein
MLEANTRHLFIYVVDRDFGFAPNPFHRFCTLATCKPGIRKSAQVGDWVIGVGGTRLKATGRCLYVMKVTETSTFDEYWADSRFRLKRPLRNGSSVMMVGDNIYHRRDGDGVWIQEDSHHSNPDGSPNMTNLRTDTSSTNVLISAHFFYFGSCAPLLDLESIGYRNIRNYRKFVFNDAIEALVKSIESMYCWERNTVIADPFNFDDAVKRVDQGTGKLS